MIHHDIYDAFKEALYEKKTESLLKLMPEHWILNGNCQPSEMVTKRMEFPFEFVTSTGQIDLNKWMDITHMLTRRHSYEQVLMFVPKGEKVLLEYKNRKLAHAWLDNKDGTGTDIVGQICYIGGIPRQIMPKENFTITGIIMSPYRSGVNSSVLKDFYPRKDITSYEFIALYGFINSGQPFLMEVLDFINKGFGFTVAEHYKASINKFDVMKKTAEVHAASGIKYICDKLLIMHNNMALIDVLNTPKSLYWGTYLEISANRLMAIVDGVSWKAETTKDGVNIFPEIILKVNKDIGGVYFGDDTTIKDNNIYIKSTYKAISEGGWRIGEIWALELNKDGDKLVSMFKEVGTTQNIISPHGCVGCGSVLKHQNEKLYCVNPRCTEVMMHGVYKWINAYSDEKFDIDVVRTLLRTYRINNLSDIYNLFDEGNITEEWNMPVVDIINKSRVDGIEKFFGIIAPGLNETVCKDIFKLVAGDWRGIFRLTIERLTEVNIERNEAERIISWITDNNVWLRNTFLSFDKNARERTSLFGKVFMITGLLYEREASAIETKILHVGGRVIKEVGKHVDYIIIGPFADSDILSMVRKNYVPPEEIDSSKFEVFYNSRLGVKTPRGRK